MRRPKRSTLLLGLVLLLLATVPVLIPLLVTKAGSAPGADPAQLAVAADPTGVAGADPTTAAPLPRAGDLVPTTASPTPSTTTTPSPSTTTTPPPAPPAPAPTRTDPTPRPEPTPTEDPTVRTAGPDLEVVEMGWSPAETAEGDQLTFTALVRNTGTDPTPVRTHGIAFSVDGTKVTWSAGNTAPLAPGETRTYTADGGPTGTNTWTATPGTHTLQAHVDDENRIPETNETDNIATTTFEVP